MEEDSLVKLKGDHPLPFKEMWSRLLKYLKPYWKQFLLAFVLICINVTLDIVTPLFTGRIVDYLTGVDIPGVPLDMMQRTVTYVVSFAVGYLALCIFNQVFLYIETMLLQHTGQKIIYELRMEVFTHIENMSQNQFNDMPVGALVTRVANYTASMSELFTNTLVQMLRNIFTVIGVYIIMLVIQPLLSAILLVFIVGVIIASLIFRKYVSVYMQNQRGALSNMNAFLNENLSGMKITQLFNQEERKVKQFDNKNDAIYKAGCNVIKAFAIYRPTVSLFYFCSIGVTFLVGIQPWIGLTAGGIIEFYLFLSRFFQPVQNLADQLNSVQKATTSSHRLFNLLDVKPEVLDVQEAKEINTFEGKIEFKDVWFAYVPGIWILKGVSFVVEPRTTAAFVGSTGSGKTTILSLIVRNYEPQKGHIYIDGIDIREIKIECLRKAIGQMLQDVFLFSGSIRTNITLHDDSYTDDEINNACVYVNADKFINKLPNRLDEEIVERGENLSQGQRQLLSFARTVLAKPQILILDEATSNIDTETEVLIQESLEKMKNIGTMFVVAHRLSTIQKSDQIFVLQKGEIIERGNHQQLLKQKGQYYKLYQLQFDDGNIDSTN